MALTKTARTVIASVANAAAATTRGTLDVEATYGGVLTMKITNGATGPTLQCAGRVLVAHNSTVPAAGSAGTDWKTIYQFGGGTSVNAVTEVAVPIDVSIMALEVEFTGNTGQSVTVEAYYSELTTV